MTPLVRVIQRRGSISHQPPIPEGAYLGLHAPAVRTIEATIKICCDDEKTASNVFAGKKINICSPLPLSTSVQCFVKELDEIRTISSLKDLTTSWLDKYANKEILCN